MRDITDKISIQVCSDYLFKVCLPSNCKLITVTPPLILNESDDSIGIAKETKTCWAYLITYSECVSKEVTIRIPANTVLINDFFTNLSDIEVTFTRVIPEIIYTLPDTLDLIQIKDGLKIQLEISSKVPSGILPFTVTSNSIARFALTAVSLIS